HGPRRHVPLAGLRSAPDRARERSGRSAPGAAARGEPRQVNTLNSVVRESPVKKALGGVGAKIASAGLVAAMLSLPMQAAADRFWLRDDGNNGIRFGTGRLHSSIEVESRYDSFAGWGQTAAVDGPEKVGDLVLHVKPALRLDVPSKTLRLGAN